MEQNTLTQSGHVGPRHFGSRLSTFSTVKTPRTRLQIRIFTTRQVRTFTIRNNLNQGSLFGEWDMGYIAGPTPRHHYISCSVLYPVSIKLRGPRASEQMCQ